MCGICGVFEYSANQPQISEPLVASMRDVMTHRGPDDSGLYINPNRRVGLGHRRLSIVDLSPAGRNPMSNEDGSVWITFNGEIYNHQKIRPWLVERGHVYRSRTDTESIIHLYEEKGLDFVQDIEGDFAIGLWDEKLGRLVLARDRIGVKPLYYALCGGRLIFGSEIKAILAHPAMSREMDEQALYHYLTFLTTPAPQTLFANIKKLPAGCMLTCDLRGDLKVTRYWDAVTQPREMSGDRQRDERECADELLRLLTESIDKRMMSDVPFGVFLSGGVDSSANVALMARLMTQPVRTFTVGFRDHASYNELEEARFVAREYRTDHHEVIIDQDDLINFLPDLVFHQDEPIADPVCVPLYYVSRLAKESGTTVVQVGEGSDELFCGYRHYANYLDLHRYLWRFLSSLPSAARRTVAAAGGLAISALTSGRPSKLGRFGPDLMRRLGAGEELFLTGALVFSETDKRSLLSGSARQRIAEMAGLDSNELSSHSVVMEDLDRLLAAKPKADELERMIYKELKLRLPELLLMRVDKITMATSVEARVPFLDHALVEFAMSLPSWMKYQNGETKHILKRALRNVVPDRVLNRRKQGFAAPINEWMLDRLGAFVEHTVLNSPLRRRDLFDYDYIAGLVNEHRSGRANHSFLLWSLLNLSLWYEHWIDPRVPSPAGRRECSPQLAFTSK
ncbi:MAG: asparagine synthase (glutamine-hydrolyzing) [Blastocatellia bacterium AA13]|nr:MAG: asparagine synthase (glutamine-hydrolyzing) [Blastocatellia bacterium AA13]